jgi:hypothetical protein
MIDEKWTRLEEFIFQNTTKTYGNSRFKNVGEGANNRVRNIEEETILGLVLWMPLNSHQLLDLPVYYAVLSEIIALKILKV